jgi:hypothetical protein
VRRSAFFVVGLALICGVLAAPAMAKGKLDVYTAKVSATRAAKLAAKHDVYGQRRAKGGVRLELVLTRGERARLKRSGVRTKLQRVKGGLTVKQFAAQQAASGFNVWRDYDGPDGFAAYMRRVARNNPQLVKLETLGTTLQGRPILALKLTQGARGIKDGKRPAVLYSATQHAREWIAGEVDRRLLAWFIQGWRDNDKQVRALLKENEYWFVPIANPDGYQYTFDHERLWRKNLRDNNEDGQITVGDGVDPNRNFPNHWKWDEEGSSSIMSSETYRGPAATSERETQAMKGLLDRIGFAFQVNYHSNGQWLLYAEGWQTSTPTADDPIYYALSGNLDEPAIEDFHPGLSPDVLYVTNGETTDYAHASTGALAWTPELSEGCDGCGFVFPDDEGAVQGEFERNLPFALSVAKSAADPDDPESVLGIETKPFYIQSDDPYKEGLPGADFDFKYSYGDPQPVRVLAKRSLGDVELKYRINGGAVQSAPTSEWEGGDRYQPADVYYHEMRGVVTGTSPGQSVEVWFEGGGERSDSFTYQAVSETGNRVLVVSAEDYSGASPPQDPGPHYLQYYLDALAQNGIQADVYDVDARGRTAPDLLGVLSHYDGVIWYTGDDIVTRKAGWPGGNADRLALDEILQMRAYMNEGGRVAYTGKRAGQQFTGAGVGTQLFDPKNEDACSLHDGLPAGSGEVLWDSRRCLLLRGSVFGGDLVNDVIEYWFGGYTQVADDGNREDGSLFDMVGIDDPFSGLSWGFGPDGADNQDSSSSYVSTSGILSPDEYPQFSSWPSSRWDKPGGPFAPHTGNQYAYSQIADVSYKRLSREVAVPAAGGDLTFWTSYDTEEHWDHLFVEAHAVGSDEWTTLPDANGHTSQDTGDSCLAENSGGWRTLHPFLDHYQTQEADGTCSPNGTTGAWNAASGNSQGWQEWSINLDAYAGQTVELSISYVSDWATQNLGVFIDDVTLPDGTSTSFESGLEGWTVSGPAPGSGTNANDWEVTDASGFPVGATITTPRSLLMGYGFEGIASQESRNAVMGRILSHLLG